MQIETRTARHDRNMASSPNFGNDPPRLLGKPGHIPFFPGVHAVYQMVRDALHLFCLDLRGSDIHSAIDLHGIPGDHLTPDLLGQFHRQSGLSRGGRTRNDKKRLLLHRSSFIQSA